MKKNLFALAVILLVTIPLSAGAPRILQGKIPAADLNSVQLDAGVGDIEVIAIDSGDEINLEIQLKPRRGGFFSSMKRAEREVDEAELDMKISKGTLRLEIETSSDDRHFEENWTIELPARLALDLDLGVGEVQVRGLAGRLSVDIGVGDVLAESVTGSVTIDLGVGDASVRAAAEDFGSVAGSGGVGDARLTVRGQRVSSSGFVGHSAEWLGEGPSQIEISVGVGDARVTLD